MPSEIKLLKFTRYIFKEFHRLSYKEICEKVKQNEENLLDLGHDHKHKVRMILFHLKKRGEIISVKRGIYEVTKQIKI